MQLSARVQQLPRRKQPGIILLVYIGTYISFNLVQTPVALIGLVLDPPTPEHQTSSPSEPKAQAKRARQPRR